MRSILPKFLLASAVMATAALATNSALAERKVSVPFSFTVNGKTCPAGLYSVDRDLTDGVVTLRNDDWKQSFMWIASSGDPAPGDNRVILRFDEMGPTHALQSVQYGDLMNVKTGWQEKAGREHPDTGGPGALVSDIGRKTKGQGGIAQAIALLSFLAGEFLLNPSTP